MPAVYIMVASVFQTIVLNGEQWIGNHEKTVRMAFLAQGFRL
jgi:hypothetical protein